LGALICPDETNTKEFQRLKKKADKLARNVTGSKLNKHEAFVLYRSIYIPAMVYSLPAVFLTRDQLEKVESKMITAVLPKMGYNRHRSPLSSWLSCSQWPKMNGMTQWPRQMRKDNLQLLNGHVICFTLFSIA